MWEFYILQICWFSREKEMYCIWSYEYLSSWTFFLLSKLLWKWLQNIGRNKQSIDYKSTWHVFRSNDFLPNCSHHWCKQLVVCDDPVLKSIDGHLEKTTQNSLFVSKSHCEDSEIGLEWMQPIYVSFDNIYGMYL